MITIVKSGTGNFLSVLRMLEVLGANAILTDDYNKISAAEKIILPGVGHFDGIANSLDELKLTDLIKKKATIDQVPLLGICVGMQFLCNYSEEGKRPGLGLIDANVLKLPQDLSNKIKIPHMGWNNVDVIKDNALIRDGDSINRFYFVHSYYVKPNANDVTIGVAEHGIKFCAAFSKKNIFGVQFHPEKSHKFGKKLFERFLEI